MFGRYLGFVYPRKNQTTSMNCKVIWSGNCLVINDLELKVRGGNKKDGQNW